MTEQPGADAQTGDAASVGTAGSAVPAAVAERVGGAFAARTILIIGGVISVLIVGVGILLAATASGDAALGGFVAGLASPFIAVVVMGLFACASLICAIRGDSRRLVVVSIWFIALATVVLGVLFAITLGGG